MTFQGVRRNQERAEAIVESESNRRERAEAIVEGVRRNQERAEAIVESESNRRGRAEAIVRKKAKTNKCQQLTSYILGEGGLSNMR